MLAARSEPNVGHDVSEAAQQAGKTAPNVISLKLDVTSKESVTGSSQGRCRIYRLLDRQHRSIRESRANS